MHRANVSIVFKAPSMTFVDEIDISITPGIDGFLCNIETLVSNVIISEGRTVKDIGIPV